MRRPKKSSGASLDSLLDTMTNVVGILVIMLTVTQLGVGDAVKRIATSDAVKPEQIDEARKRLEELELIRARLLAMLEALKQEHQGEDLLQKLRRLQKEIADYQADVDVLGERQQSRQLEIDKLRQEVQTLIDKQEEEAEQLLDKRNKGEEELASLRAQLEDTRVAEALPAKVINLPNPRAAPEGIEPVTLICREGRVMFVDAPGIQDLAQKRAAFIIQRRNLGRDPAAGIDAKILTEEFNGDPIKDRSRTFDVRMTISGRVPMLVLERREEAGETAEQLNRSSSQYQRQVKRVDPRGFYLRFLVWPDSFEAYLEAREIASKRGLLAGWQAQTTTDEYTINLGGDLKVGPPPPPPKPKPNPKPGEEPPPKPKPAAPPRPLPTDVID